MRGRQLARQKRHFTQEHRTRSSAWSWMARAPEAVDISEADLARKVIAAERGL